VQRVRTSRLTRLDSKPSISEPVPYVTHRPSEPVSRFVDYLWWLSDSPAHAHERIVPTGTPELVINLHDDAFDIRSAPEASVRRFSGAMVSGCYSKYFVIDTRAHASLLGVHFKPGGARAILGLPLSELADRHVDLEVLWGPRARELRERLGNAARIEARFQIIESELRKRLPRDSQLGAHPAVTIALHHLANERHPVGEIARELGLTGRRFIELFGAEVGMTPKLYGRVQRFQSALRHSRRAGPQWTELALDAGYYDQSHLIRDFVSFSGFSPSELLCHAAPAPKEHHLAHAGKIRPRRP